MVNLYTINKGLPEYSSIFTTNRFYLQKRIVSKCHFPIVPYNEIHWHT